MSCKNIIKSAAFGSFQCGTEIQGGIHLCSTCMMLREQEQIAAPAKRDFENLDVRLYLALAALRKAVNEEHPEWVSHSAIQPAWAAAGMVMLDFEDSHGHLPEWAIARNFGLELVVGTQLFTKNGRRHGNGWLVAVTVESHASLSTRENPYGEWTAYTVLTDAGSLIGKMSEKELEGAFEVGDFICSLDRIAKDFDRHGLLREEVQGG